MHLVLLGAPGAGKGTQAKVLEAMLGIPQVSTGDMLRAARAAGSELGQRVQAIMDRGELVSDEIVLELVADRLRQPDAARGAIFDGFPRTVAQAEALEKLQPVDRVISIEVPGEDLVGRMSGRRTCRSCGRMYHIAFNPPDSAGVCDACGGELYQRADDNETSIRHRLQVYLEKTAPLIAYYAKKGLLSEVSGTGDMDEVTARVMAVVGSSQEKRR